ncbi:SPOC like C-terminal domain-containing protein [Halteromyces radiatus]|uniref:SPOC like C-terminal domain-containing protein n=1 Tax=Halteromyces radiatus TaxID=101107 RepID=UPI002220ACF6|nr:SPOC like C-terminal domain-containing protein [Halteromyces radiatus]KAI8082883.1 SPOC like C-terminal domain-containing protein [Halteromyces radiatus]
MTQKATSFVLNCNSSMAVDLPTIGKTAFQAGIDVILDALGEKVLYDRKMDKANVILSGTTGTENELADENADQYQHITTVCPIMQPNVATLRTLVNCTVSESKDMKADIMDALILAIHMIVKGFGRLKYIKQVVLITDAVDPIDWRDVDDVKGMLETENIKLVIIGVNFDANGVIKDENEDSKSQQIKVWNQQNWKKLSQTVPGATIHSIHEAYENAKGMKTKEIKPMPSYRGFLYLGDPRMYDQRALSININMFPLTSVAHPPAAKKWSTLSDLVQNKNNDASSSPRHLTHAVNMIRKYRLKDTGNNTDTQQPAHDDSFLDVDPNTLEKVYPFGKTLVKITAEEEEYLRIQTTPGMWIIGFLGKDAVRRDYILSKAYLIVAGANNTEPSGVAIAALARGLYEKEALALVRYVQKANSEPVLGIISPYIDVDINALEFCQIAFAEDIRQYTFNSLDKVVLKSGKIITEDHPLLPTQEMKESMTDFVKHMSIKTEDQEEDYQDAFNPLIWRFHTAIKARAMNEAAPIPELHPKLKQEMTRNPILEEENSDRMKQMASLFQVKKVDLTKKRKGKYGRNKQTTDSVVTDSSQLTPIEQVMSGAKQGEEPDMKRSKMDNNNGALRIGVNHPVQDFYAMLNNEQDLVTAAVTQMSELIQHLVTTSFGDQHYDRIMDCLKVFREAAAKENEAGVFNQCLYQLKRIIDPASKTSRYDLWQRLQKENMTLITKDEAMDDEVANVTKDDAEKFLTDTEKESTLSSAPSSKPEENNDMSTEDLLAMMD